MDRARSWRTSSRRTCSNFSEPTRSSVASSSKRKRGAREAAPQESAAGDASAATQQGTSSDEEEFISTVEQLRAFTSTVERANELLRKRLTSEQKKRVFDDWRRAAEEEDSELMRPYATVVTKEWYGYPEGTRIVCVGLLLFHVELVRVGSGYKVLAMYLLDD